MAFRVDITEPALIEAEEYVQFIRDVRKEPDAADRWFRGLVHAIYSLEALPERCSIVPEQEEFSFEIRHLIYFSHRIIFRIEHDKQQVIVYRVYRAFPATAHSRRLLNRHWFMGRKTSSNVRCAHGSEPDNQKCLIIMRF